MKTRLVCAGALKHYLSKILNVYFLLNLRLRQRIEQL